jgi:hypothetical protein
MNVKELIEKLQEYPQDASVAVLYSACSDYSILEADELSFIPAPGIIQNKNPYPNNRQYVLRNGQVMLYDPKTWPKDEVPSFLNLLIFPGN